MQLPFHDRRDAGSQLAALLADLAGNSRGLVLALPRGGVPVGYQVARELGLPLDVFIVRKLGMPGHEELALGALASGGIRVVNQDLVREMGVAGSILERIAANEQIEIERRDTLYRENRPALAIEGRDVLLVDDGLATGATMIAAIRAVRSRNPASITVAVPVGSDSASRNAHREADRVVCGFVPAPFYSVGEWYRDFNQTSDAEVRHLLQERVREFHREAYS